MKINVYHNDEDHSAPLPFGTLISTQRGSSLLVYEGLQSEINFRNLGFSNAPEQGMIFRLKVENKINKRARLGIQDRVERILSQSSDVKFISSTEATTRTLPYNDEKPVLFRTERQKKKCKIIIGDSNTKLIQFGSGKGSMGGSYPGRRIKAARIRNIKPADCCGHANIVIGLWHKRPSAQ